MTIDTRVLPEDIAKDLRYTNNGRQGDRFPCELMLTFFDERLNPHAEVIARHAWLITGTDWDPAESRGEAQRLEEEMRERHLDYLLRRLQSGLHRSKSMIVREGGRLIRWMAQ